MKSFFGYPWPTKFEFALRTCSILIFILQCVLLNWYLVHYGGSLHAVGWIAGDIVVLITFILSYVYADEYFKQNRNKPKPKPKNAKGADKTAEAELGTVGFIGPSDANGETDTETTTLRANKAAEEQSPVSEPEEEDDHSYEYEPSFDDLYGDEEEHTPDEAVEAPRVTYYAGRPNSHPDLEVGATKTHVSKRKKKRKKPRSVVDRYREYQKKAKVREDQILDSLETGPIREKYHLGALPLAYISWALYSSTLIAKMMVIFMTFGETLDSNLLFGSNMLELSFASTAAVYALLISAHKRIPRHQKLQKAVINYMQGRVLMDILDSVELLEFVYAPSPAEAAAHETKIQPAVKIAILFFVSIQLFLPTLGLYQLSATNFAHHHDPTSFWNTLHQALNLFFENIPFLVIRIYLWSRNQFTESTFVFIIKNIFEITMNDWDFIVLVKLWIYQRMYTKSTKEPKAKKVQIKDL